MSGPKGIDHLSTPSTMVREVSPPESDATENTHLLGAERGRSRQKSWDSLSDLDGLPWWRKPSVYWLIVPYAIFALAFGGIIVPKMSLIVELVATFMLVMSLVTGILSAIIAPKLGHMSDRYGRRRLMAVASCGGLMGELVTILAATFPEVINYRWLILGAVFDGLGGSFTAGSILSQSYTSDCTPPSKRAVSIGYIHACLFTGLAFGPLLAAYFVKWTGTLISIFYVAFCCHIVFIFFVGFIIPESLSKRKQAVARGAWEREKQARGDGPKSWSSRARASNPLLPIKILWLTGPGTTSRLRINLVALAISDTIVMGTVMAVGSVLMLYGQLMFKWGNFEVSNFLSIISLARVFVLVVIFPTINYFGRIRPAARRERETGQATVERNSGADRLDIWILRVALVSDIIGCVGYILAGTGTLFAVSGMVTAMGGLGSATLQAVITKHVPPERVGQILGAVGTLQALARVVGPVMFNGLYALTVGSFPQAIFVLLASLYGVAFICSFVVKSGVFWKDVGEHDDTIGSIEPALDDTAGRELAAGEEQGLLR
ncbi:hypothetical protein PT974_00812 [Cladobotryum mycophilum]|uniref:Major facilitator superfamily (MFS) profile domain-containing protein n=1 Tax=Cladobotryum mycophilum TaxID=491253 RepID=A0ABR0T238_9HYPO